MIKKKKQNNQQLSISPSVKTYNYSVINDQSSKKEIINKIISTKEGIDKELERIVQTDKKYFKNNKALQSLDHEGGRNLPSQNREHLQLHPSTRRIIMDEGVYDYNAKLDQSPLPLNSSNAESSKKHLLPSIFGNKPVNSQRNQQNLQTYMKSVPSPSINSSHQPQHKQDSNYSQLSQMNISNNAQNQSLIYQPSNSQRYLEYITKPTIGVNNDRFNTLVAQDQQQSQIVSNKIKNLIQDFKRNNSPFEGNSGGIGSEFSVPSKLYRIQGANQSHLENSGLGYGNRVDYFNRQYPQF